MEHAQAVLFFVAGGASVSNLFGDTPKVVPEFTGLQVNTAVQVLPIPILYGTPRVSINLIYYNGFNIKSVKSGKGILSGGKGGKQLEYFATLILGIGEGPIGKLKAIYQDQGVWLPLEYPSNGAYYYTGSATQTPWSYITTFWPKDARAYPYTAYAAFSNAELDASATVPQINLLQQGFFAGTCPLNDSKIKITTGEYNQNAQLVSFEGKLHLGFADADPAQCIWDFLTNPIHGATFPSNWISLPSLFTSVEGYDPSSGDAALSTYCQAVGFGWSLVLSNAESALSILERWCSNLVVAIVWDGSLLSFIPYWDAYCGINPGWAETSNLPRKYFQPFTQACVSITLDHILEAEDQETGPITYMRKDPLEVYNTVRLDFRDRKNFFNNVPAEAKDEALIELVGPRIDNIGTSDEFTLNVYAVAAVNARLRRNVSIRRTYRFRLGPLWAWLKPMDIVEIPDPVNFSSTIVVRITSLDDDEDENITVEAEEFPVGTESPTLLPMTDTTPPDQGVSNVIAPPTFPPVMFELPPALLTAWNYTADQFILGASGGYDNVFATNWGGCNIWISLDGENYTELGTLTLSSTYGQLAATLPKPSGGNPDNIDTLSVNLSPCNDSLGSYSVATASTYASLCIVQDESGFELLAYT